MRLFPCCQSSVTVDGMRHQHVFLHTYHRSTSFCLTCVSSLEVRSSNCVSWLQLSSPGFIRMSNDTTLSQKCCRDMIHAQIDSTGSLRLYVFVQSYCPAVTSNDTITISLFPQVHKMLLLQDDTRDSCLDVAKLILDPRSIVRKIIRGSVYSNCFPLRAKAAQVMLDMLDETCADETLEGDIVSALQNLPSQPGVPFLEAFTEASMTSLVMLNNWNPNVLKPWINSKDLFKTCIVRSMFYLKDKIRENCCSSLQLHKMKFATNSDLTWQWASILCRFCPREEECSNLMESILQLMRHSTVKKIKVACIELGAELLSRGYQEDFKVRLYAFLPSW